MAVIGSGPSNASLKQLNIKNNLAGIYLRKQLDQYKREKTFSLSHLDRDKFDTRDFLKQVNKIESDNNHAAITYLGRTPTSLYKSRRTTKTSQESIPQACSTADDRTESVPLPTPATDIKPATVPAMDNKSISPPPITKTQTMPEITFSTPLEVEIEDETKDEVETPRKKSGLRHSSTLPSLKSCMSNRRGSIYLQIAAVAKSPSEFSVSSEERDSEDEDEKPKRISTRRKSFIAWINEKKKNGGLLPIIPDSPVKLSDERRRQSFLAWLKNREIENRLKGRELVENRAKSTPLEEIFEDQLLTSDASEIHGLSTSRTESVQQNRPTFKQTRLFTSLNYIKKVKKEPLEKRLKQFYAKLEEIKERDRSTMRALRRASRKSVLDLSSQV